MPADDVSDLRDVVDAINRLCETMKTSDYGDARDASDVEPCAEVETEVSVESEVGLVNPEQIVVCEVETYVAELWSDASSHHADAEPLADSPTPVDIVSSSSVALDSNWTRWMTSHQPTRVETETVPTDFSTNRKDDTVEVISDPSVTQLENVETVVSSQPAVQVESVVYSSVATAPDSVVLDHEQVTATFEPVSEMYYTASSEVSLLSDVELPDRIQEETVEGRENLTRDDRNGVLAGHVAAMRERFESMTRANTPCPDVMRSVSPSLDVYRNVTPSPDHLG